MAVQISPYSRDLLVDMVALYNNETAFEPYIAPLTPGMFVELIERKSYFRPQGLAAAMENGRMVGWIHAGAAKGADEHSDQNVVYPQIYMLILRRDRFRTGGQLVSHILDYVKSTGQQAPMAMHVHGGFPFYRGIWLGCEPMGPATMPHVQIAFETAGFKVAPGRMERHVFMTATIADSPEIGGPAVPAEFVSEPAEMQWETMAESWKGFEPRCVKVRVDGVDAGGIWWAMIPHLADRLGSPCANIYNFMVNKEFRRKGLGRSLIRHVLAEARQQGARHASVLTWLSNLAGAATYLSCGFRPHCLCFGRVLRPPEHPKDDC